MQQGISSDYQIDEYGAKDYCGIYQRSEVTQTQIMIRLGRLTVAKVRQATVRHVTLIIQRKDYNASVRGRNQEY